ncbi:hypothetical protein [Methylococcus geothermalis]|uniref:Uncharacterized protein n=1 Tax=Methylococcus geothermalis TaxID=2681310 RepID=A0A858Q672_9GAMM|nr:hypothetical protein [Methylococcus geothermalis]QJD29348.1 hypothetical protein GNH96_04785 [Methylococcus geothermalis]
MKTSAHLPYLVVAVLFLQPASPSLGADNSGEPPSIERIGREMKETAQSIGDYSSRKGSEAADSMKSGFNELKSRTSEQWAQVDRAARDTSKEALDQASTQADRLKNGSKDAWGHIRQGFSDAFSSFRQAWDTDGARK